MTCETFSAAARDSFNAGSE